MKRNKYYSQLSLRQSVLPTWQRIVLLIILAYEGLGGLTGGSMLVARPDGKLMNMPVDIMHGALEDFTIPGIILLCLGLLNCFAFLSVLRKFPSGWFMANTAMAGYLIWFIVEIVILQELHWLHAMWGLPVVFGFWIASRMIPKQQETLTKAFLVSGILASLLYVLLNIFIPTQWEEYNSASQTVSELSAIDAPTRQLWVLASLPYTFLMIAFGWGVLRSAHQKPSIKMVGCFLLAYSLLGILWPFAPMHLRETLAAGGSTISDTFHIALGAITEILFFLSLGFAAWSFGKSFKVYSVLTFIIMMIFGLLTFLDAPGIASNQPTPYIGVWERINIGVFLLWIVVLGILLLKGNHKIYVRPDIHSTFRAKHQRQVALG